MYLLTRRWLQPQLQQSSSLSPINGRRCTEVITIAVQYRYYIIIIIITPTCSYIIILSLEGRGRYNRALWQIILSLFTCLLTIFRLWILCNNRWPSVFIVTANGSGRLLWQPRDAEIWVGHQWKTRQRKHLVSISYYYTWLVFQFM